jgi:hypothetical protein
MSRYEFMFYNSGFVWILALKKTGSPNYFNVFVWKFLLLFVTYSLSRNVIIVMIRVDRVQKIGGAILRWLSYAIVCWIISKLLGRRMLKIQSRSGSCAENWLLYVHGMIKFELRFNATSYTCFRIEEAQILHILYFI